MAANLAVTTPDDGGALSMLAEASSFDASDALSMLADASLSDRLQENPVGSAAHILHIEPDLDHHCELANRC